MSLFPSDVKIFLALTPVDFRKGPDSLLALVRDSGSDPFNGALYAFRAKRADRIKIVWWDGSGVCLYTKRLERSGFSWPRAGQARFQLNQAQLMALVDGLDWTRVRPVQVRRPELVGWAPTNLAPTTSAPPRAAPNGVGGVDWGYETDTGKGGGGGGKGDRKLDQLLESLQSEREVLDSWYQESLDLLNDATEQQLEALGGKHEAIERLEQEHRERMRGLQDAAQQWSLESALTGGAEVLSAMGAFNPKALKISQVFAAGEALISTYKGAAKELEKGTLGFATAAAVIAKGIGFVAAIKGVNTNGSGGGRAGGGGVPAVSQPAETSRPVNVLIQGIRSEDLYSGKQFIAFTEAIQKQFERRGVKFVYNS